jgi:hypothetical protein
MMVKISNLLAISIKIFVFLTLTIAHFCLAQSSNDFLPKGEPYFSGQVFESAKSVQLIGAPRTSENIEREAHVGKIVELHLNQLRYCYERALARGKFGGIHATFYFTVSPDGSFGNVAADLNVFSGDSPAVTALFTCASQQIGNFRAAKFTSENTFRFKANFGGQ